MGGMRFTTFDLGGHQQGQSFYRAKTITKLSIHLFIVELVFDCFHYIFRTLITYVCFINILCV